MGSLEDEVRRYYWHHSIDLGDGIVTPGAKTLEDLSAEYSAIFNGVDITGRSVLDVGAWNGAFSFEVKRRGAADVLATDSYCWQSPVNGRATFELARSRLALDVRATDIDVMAITPALGYFDVTLFLGVFYHLVDPIEGLSRVASVTRDLLIVETYLDAGDITRPAMIMYPGHELANDSTNWWGPNRACVEHLLRLNHFDAIVYQHHPAHGELRGIFHAFRSREQAQIYIGRQVLGTNAITVGSVPSAVAPHPRDSLQENFQRLEVAISSAESVQDVGLLIPPMTHRRGLTRAFALLLARAVLRMGQMVTRDQRAFNRQIVAALRIITTSLSGVPGPPGVFSRPDELPGPIAPVERQTGAVNTRYAERPPDNRAEVGGAEHRVLLVDVTYHLMHDARSGLQRVEREISHWLGHVAPNLCQLTFVAWDKRHRAFREVDIRPVLESSSRPGLESYLDACPMLAAYPGAHFLILASNWPLGEPYLEDVSALARQGLILSALVPDLIPLRHRWDFYAHHPPGTTIDLFAVFSTRVLPQCTSILTISEHVARDVHRFLVDAGDGISASRTPRVHVLTLGSDWSVPVRAPAGQDHSRRMIENPYLLYVSTLERRKNHALLLDAFSEVRRQVPELELALVGAVDASLSRMVLDRVAREPGIHHFASAGDATLERLYEDCLFTVYPSLDEGYGLPVVESLRRGRFCLASAAGAIPEAGGQFADYFDPGDAGELARKIVLYVTDPKKLTERMLQLRSFQPVSWRTTARQVIQALCGVPADAGNAQGRARE